ncbi:hypothetical protein ACQ859_16350 [Roseateles chitinivorans]|uniref:hypothetical protein n=1 Tax=Roseateles chitinivorans TaxID=2917965 RepID=UPI003D672C38
MSHLLDRLARALGYHTSEELRQAEVRALRAAQPPASDPSAPIQDESGATAEGVSNPEAPIGHLKYFVAYSFSASRGTGFGSCEVSLNHPIRSSKDTQAIAEAVARRFAHDPGPKAVVVILNWRRYEEPEPPDGGREDIPDEENAPVLLRLVA